MTNMWKFKGNRASWALLITIVLVGILLQEVEGRRKILRGRKTITRTYYKSLGLPSWFVMLLVHGGLLLAGAISYAVLYRLLIVRNKLPYLAPLPDRRYEESQRLEPAEMRQPETIRLEAEV